MKNLYRKIRGDVCYRLGRYLYMSARLERDNGIETNGESRLIDRIAQQYFKSGHDGSVVLLDIGANKGEWSKIAAQCFARWLPGIDCRIHACEPAADTFERLSHGAQRFGRVQILPHNLAISNSSGFAGLQIYGSGSGRNSLVDADGSEATQEVQTITIDDFLRKNNIGKVLFAKSDTEGNDFRVIEGALGAFQSGSLSALQFEYNHRWLSLPASLKQVFEIACDLGLKIGRVTPMCAVSIPRWHQEIDRFFESNYVICASGMGDWVFEREAIITKSGCLIL